MFEKEFNDVYGALQGLTNIMCKEVDNTCKKCPFYNGIPHSRWGCDVMKAKEFIRDAEARVKVREQHKNNNNN